MILHVSLNKEDSLPESYPSIQEAYDQLVLYDRQGKLEGQSVILVHGGDYTLKKSLHFYADVPVEIRPYEQDTVTISGGEVLTGWKKTRIGGKNVWKTLLPESVDEIPFLFVDGKMAQAARWPKKDFFRVTDERSGFSTDDATCDNFHVKEGDFDPDWYDPENIEIKMIHLWIEETLKFRSFDKKNGCLTTASSLRYVASKANTEYAFYNVREALSEPGEYYFDRRKHELLLVSENPDFKAVIPSCGVLARFDSGVQHVVLSGLHFRYGGTHLPRLQNEFDLRDPEFPPVRNFFRNIEKKEADKAKKDSLPCYSASQGATHVPGVILFENASGCVVRNCTVSACAWYGIQIAGGCSRLIFRENEISGLGGGGFLVCGGGAEAVKRNPETLTSRLVIRDNHIHDCGLHFLSAIGILLGHVCGCRVEGNHIHDLYYSGISCGWKWGFGDQIARENCICRNHIHDLGKGVLSDMGGIYLLGIQPGTHVYENVIHGIVNRYYGGWGLYTDEGSSHIVLERNVVYDCACEGFHQHYGRENIIRYNIFAFNKQYGVRVTTDSNTIGFDWPGDFHDKAVNLFNNVILTDGTPAYCLSLKSVFTGHRIFSDCNVVFDISKKERHFADVGDYPDGVTLAEWQKNGHDRHSVFQDPGFRNAGKRDFRLKKNSLLREYGFEFLDKILK